MGKGLAIALIVAVVVIAVAVYMLATEGYLPIPGLTPGPPKITPASEYKVKYEFEYRGPEGAQRGTMTMAIKGDKVKVHYVLSKGEFAVYKLDDRVVGCIKTPMGWRCIAGKTVTPFSPEEYTKVEPEKCEYLGTRQIAGEEAHCFATEEDVEVCFTSDGIPVYIKTQNFTMEAEEIYRTVSDEEFRPPKPAKPRP